MKAIVQSFLKNLNPNIKMCCYRCKEIGKKSKGSDDNKKYFNIRFHVQNINSINYIEDDIRYGKELAQKVNNYFDSKDVTVSFSKLYHSDPFYSELYEDNRGIYMKTSAGCEFGENNLEKIIEIVLEIVDQP